MRISYDTVAMSQAIRVGSADQVGTVGYVRYSCTRSPRNPALYPDQDDPRRVKIFSDIDTRRSACTEFDVQDIRMSTTLGETQYIGQMQHLPFQLWITDCRILCMRSVFVPYGSK
jgi:hypothetical protein